MLHEGAIACARSCTLELRQTSTFQFWCSKASSALVQQPALRGKIMSSGRVNGADHECECECNVDDLQTAELGAAYTLGSAASGALAMAARICICMRSGCVVTRCRFRKRARDGCMHAAADLNAFECQHNCWWPLARAEPEHVVLPMLRGGW